MPPLDKTPRKPSLKKIVEQRVLATIAFDEVEQKDQTGEESNGFAVSDLRDSLPHTSPGQIGTAVASLKRKGLIKDLRGMAQAAVTLTPHGWRQF